MTSTIAVALSLQTVPSSAHNYTGAAIAAGILGLAVGAAVADSARPRDPGVYGAPATTYYGPPPPFSPTPGVSCYPARRQCYMPNGLLDWTWTDRVFAQ
ncbi:hypothetical protein OSH11_01365 [Kaistia dalseonensis]|uniref:Uncharacterized protein n=1 Tax=Kaistia dalseonensis TaxID=410840 RepID=A0ABU0H0T8_9HYPH|nr:hypothetical protein [Kaistia dalseonensis]MCX5493345.1 hypothetical protein [Kaistia dalseonensis]MDQ0435902.1 hypothetical protein [Kaistia dalseonensis]